jgi:glucosamine kinase
MTGLNGLPPEPERLTGRLTALGLCGEVFVADDCVTAYLGALGPVSGAVVVAGTGAVALAVNAGAAGAGEGSARVDGWGGALGDHGSGYSIGRAAIRRALRDRDRGRRTRLLAAVDTAFGPVATMPERWRRTPPEPAAVAGFAAEVAVLARAGEPEARRIWQRAGRSLAESAAIALDRAGLGHAEVPVAGTGGLFQHAGDLLLASFGRTLRDGAERARPVPAAGDPLAGALALTGREHGPAPLATLVVRSPFGEKARHP